MGSIPHSFGEALPLLPHNVTIFGDGDFKEVTKVKWALIQSDRYSHKKRRLGHTKRHQTCVCVRRKDCVNTQRKGSHLQATERSFRRSQACWLLDLRLPATSTVRKYFCGLSHPACGILLLQRWQMNAPESSQSQFRRTPFSPHAWNFGVFLDLFFF